MNRVNKEQKNNFQKGEIKMVVKEFKTKPTKLLMVGIVAITLVATSLSGSCVADEPEEKEAKAASQPVNPPASTPAPPVGDIVTVYSRIYTPDIVSTLRPPIIGTHGVVSSAHTYISTNVGYDMLKKGGNAFDAGVAAAMALQVVKMSGAGWMGVTPFLGYEAGTGKVWMRPGVGTAPKAATPEWYTSRGFKVMPRGTEVAHLCAIMPTQVDTYVAILQDLGTVSLAEALEGTIRICEEGYPAPKAHVNSVLSGIKAGYFEQWPYNGKVWLIEGRAPKVGEIIYQKDLAKTFRLLVAAEQKALANGKSRYEALQTARDIFYKGQIARDIAAFNEEIGGLVTYDDVANFRGEWETPTHTNYKGIDVYMTNTVTQGPLLIEFLNMVENFDVVALGHNSPEYIHLLSQIINLGMSDRWYYYGDPKFVDIPDGLWTKEYAKERIKLIDPNKAFPEMPPKGNPWAFGSTPRRASAITPQMLVAMKATEGRSQATQIAAELGDTTAICVMDEQGNIFTMTPSDGHFRTPMIPGYGFGLSERGRRFTLGFPGQPAEVAPGKRPMNTTNPGLALKNGKPYMTWTTPSGDSQCQTHLQMFLNIVEFGMDVQVAMDQPRFRSSNFIATSSPYPYDKGVIRPEENVGQEVLDALAAMGHKVDPYDAWRCPGSMSWIVRDEDDVMWAGGDARGEGYAAGW